MKLLAIAKFYAADNVNVIDSVIEGLGLASEVVAAMSYFRDNSPGVVSRYRNGTGILECTWGANAPPGAACEDQSNQPGPE